MDDTIQEIAHFLSTESFNIEMSWEGDTRKDQRADGKTRECESTASERGVVFIKERRTTCVEHINTRLCQSSSAAVTNYHNLGGLKQHKSIIIQFWRSKNLKWVQLNKIECQQQRVLSQRLQGRISFLDFPSCQMPATFPTSLLYLEKSLWLHWAHLDTPRYFPHFKLKDQQPLFNLLP